MTTNKNNNYSDTLHLPNTSFSMRAGLPKKEPELLSYWEEINLFERLRDSGQSRKKFILHDGPPYANGNIHIGHALNKVLKDIVVRSFQMRGFDANYVPGWDCHGLPIEWKIESEYIKQGKNKSNIPINEFRQECRNFAAKWVSIQSEEFKRLGVIGNFKNPYTTMNTESESIIASELLKLAKKNQVYRGTKPVMWSVAERTTLAEAEIEYHNIKSDSIWVAFHVKSSTDCLKGTQIIIWTTTPWTIPGNRAIAFSSKSEYGIYKVVASNDKYVFNMEKKVILSKSLANETAKKTNMTIEFVCDVKSEDLKNIICSHPLNNIGYDFPVPLIDADFVSNDCGTGFVHMAPSHGVEDFEAWIAAKDMLESNSIDTKIPLPVDDRGFYTADAPGFPDVRVLDDNGEKGNANDEVISALIDAHAIIGKVIIEHSYPHSWRSKKPVIFRNAPQWFLHLDKNLGDGSTIRSRALAAINQTNFYPSSSENRLQSMIESRPDWVLSRQRAWGIPICLFYNEKGEILIDEAVNDRIIEVFKKQGSDAWFDDNMRGFFLGERASEPWIQSQDILDVWFDSAATHAFALEKNKDLTWPADVYLEGSDQHRGWFQHSLLESCATRGSSPFKSLITHGFAVDEKGEKMSKSKGNVISPNDIISESGADILRFWVASSDYNDDQRLGKNIIQTNIDSYRKLRNTIRWMIGVLSHDKGQEMPFFEMPELERLVLHRMTEIDQLVREGYDNFNFKIIIRNLIDFVNTELSSFYFDIRKDALYCDPSSSIKRIASIAVIRRLCRNLILWLAPIIPFTAEEAWRCLETNDLSVHLKQMPELPQEWKDVELSEKWKKIVRLRKVVTCALEIERKEKRIGSSLETAPVVYISEKSLIDALKGQDFAEICITSETTLVHGEGPSDSFRLTEVPHISVQCKKASGKKCARSWKITKDVGTDPEYPDVSARDAIALRELGYNKH
ncbi:isoleucine--tRNA ligase [Candidatus Liberibacter americanus]|uniref:Isoleucine--tRNA ligase n=1 Tax=Candidatus Liberibacter americanus str. Sao Paulo TaxID=1261131 RepID=U6B6F9_9HYPH|nr:isoleucine--tRNA ligase [Candidatus Liberibacter americanus]AHA27456.1 Isoleucyl-tRNA synthetase [Candidatus Liberibacter americanus str. Sao Paulo]EMS36729.1 isoleucyl-tRNA synthetase [Candidatus Liberibacter americanus PW_SP]